MDKSNDFRLHDGRTWSNLPEWEQAMLTEELADFLDRIQRIDVATVAAGITQASQQMGQALVNAFAPIAEALKRHAEVLEGMLRIPEGTTIVRPLGHRSNSRQWLAWSGNAWQPCRRRNGVWYWVIDDL